MAKSQKERRMAMSDRQSVLSVKASKQLSEIFSQLSAGVLTDEHLQAFIEHRNPFEGSKNEISGDWLTKLLGKNRLVTALEASQILGFKMPATAPIRYIKATIRRCAKENQKKAADWRLIYINGASLLELLLNKTPINDEIFLCYGRNPHQIGTLFNPHLWWDEDEEDREEEWVNFKPVPGYYLINFQLKFRNKNWSVQEEAIRKMGSEFARCDDAMLAEALFSVLNVHRECLMTDLSHCGNSIDSSGQRIIIGQFGNNGLHVGGLVITKPHIHVGVAIYRKWDF